jgi:hypothetical protein
MLDLQREQFEHDERFHREILYLSIHARLNHMALHFCKYTGQLAEACSSGNAELRSRTIVDSFIISLCSANALTLNLSAHIAPDLGYPTTLRDLGLYLGKTLYASTKLDDHWLFVAHARFAGKLARACEKIDHLEEFPFREEMRDAVLELCRLTLVAAGVHAIDLLSAVRDRRKQIRNPVLIAMYGQES